MPRKVYIRLRQDELDALVQVARAERRHPSDQAATFVAAALRQAHLADRPNEQQHQVPAEAGAH